MMSEHCGSRVSHWLQDKIFKILIKSQSLAEELVVHLVFKTRKFSLVVKAALKTKKKKRSKSCISQSPYCIVLFTSFHFRRKSTGTRSQEAKKLHFLRMSTRQKTQDGAHVLQLIGGLSFNG